VTENGNPRTITISNQVSSKHWMYTHGKQLLADGGIRAVSSQTGELLQEVYYCAVIDILQVYNIGKMLERGFKGMLYDKDEISSVPPDLYCARFQTFIAKTFI